MKSRITFVLKAAFVSCFVLFASGTIAQEEPDAQTPGKKTITIHVTKEVDGNVVVIDTTVVTDGDFDADAFLMGKGVLNDMPETSSNIDKRVIIMQPGKDMDWSDSKSHSGDTIALDKERVYVFSDKFDIEMPPPPADQFHHFQFDTPDGFPFMNEQLMQSMMEGMAHSYGLDGMMPFGEMKQVVVKKKRNGKKVIITFEDKDKSADKNIKKEEKVIILRDSDMGDLQHNDERMIIKGNPGEKIIIKEDVDTKTNEKRVTVNVETDNKTPKKTQTKVIFIKEGEEK
jgi:hypothetical protein